MRAVARRNANRHARFGRRAASASVITRSAIFRDASHTSGRSTTPSACNGVFVRDRRTVHTSRSGASNVLSVGGGDVRFQNVYIPRRYKSFPWLCVYVWAVHFAPSARLISSSHNPDG